jgi:hypothetical protein
MRTEKVGVLRDQGHQVQWQIEHLK